MSSSTARQLQADKDLKLSQGIAYALPTVVIAFLSGPIAILQGLYAKYFGLSLSAIATVILIARLFDAISDPAIGYLSDRYYRRTGSRKVFVFSGAILFVVSSYFLYIPFGFNSKTDSVSSLYFLFCFLAFYLSYTLYEVPHLAWGREIVFDAKGKNKIYSLRAVASYVGLFLFFIVPLLPFFETSEFTPTTLAWSVVIAALLMVPILYICLKNVSPVITDRNENASIKPFLTAGEMNKDGVKKYGAWREIASFVFLNRPFLIFIGAFFLTGFGVGMWFALMFIFVDAYLDLGGYISQVYLISYGVSIACLGLWYKLANWKGKKAAWSLGTLMMAAGILATGALTPDCSWVVLLLCTVVINVGMLASIAIAPSLLADIVDYGTWKFGQDYGASYFSLYTLITKINLAIGGALGLAIAGGFGFDPTVSTQSPQAIFGMRLSIAWIPSLITLFSILLIALIPIDARWYRVNQRRLAQKTLRNV